MKLQDLFEQQSMPLFGFFTDTRGPNDMPGVSLMYVMPVEVYYERLIANARDDNREQRIKKLIIDRDRYRSKGQTHFYNDIDWWMSKEAFEKGDEGFGGMHKGRVLEKYPNLRIFNNQKEAVDAAKQAGILTINKPGA